MTMNIYITKENEEQLRKLKSYTMSGLVNYLLTDYFKSNPASELVRRVERKAEKKMPELYNETGEQAIRMAATRQEWSGPIYRDKKKGRL